MTKQFYVRHAPTVFFITMNNIQNGDWGGAIKRLLFCGFQVHANWPMRKRNEKNLHTVMSSMRHEKA